MQSLHNNEHEVACARAGVGVRGMSLVFGPQVLAVLKPAVDEDPDETWATRAEHGIERVEAT